VLRHTVPVPTLLGELSEGPIERFCAFYIDWTVILVTCVGLPFMVQPHPEPIRSRPNSGYLRQVDEVEHPRSTRTPRASGTRASRLMWPLNRGLPPQVAL
jgi:hypothetical protein